MSSTSPSKQEVNIFARNDGEAACWFERYKSEDPFPEIAPALLNSADIIDYVAATGMIYPFYPEIEILKTASYEVNMLGKCVYWDEKGEKQVLIIKRGDEFNLKQNSIAFVTLEPMFRIPDYIALRFNLKITHVYRGILLGTGPLVDPGYHNKLSIPLHNLTTNDYIFKGGDPLIWMEFTKLSLIQSYQPNSIQNSNLVRQGEYREFPKRKNELRDVELYLRKADPHRPIRSSIPEAMLEAQTSAEKSARSAKEAEGRAESIRTRLTYAAVLGTAALLVALHLGFYPILSLVEDSILYVNSARKELDTHRRTAEKEKNQFLEREIHDLREEIEELKKAQIDRSVEIRPSGEVLQDE